MEILAIILLIVWIVSWIDPKAAAKRKVETEEWERYFRRSDVQQQSDARQAIVKLRAQHIRKIRNRKFKKNES